MSRRIDVLRSEISPDAEEPESVPVTARLEGGVGGDLDHKVNGDT